MPMPYVQGDGAQLYYEESGSGHPLLFVHEFAADHRDWEMQMRWFARSYRCIVFNARGYPPSDVPERDQDYGEGRAIGDIFSILSNLGIRRAHIVGLSMGAYAALRFGLQHPDMTSALVLAGCGSGAPYRDRQSFKQMCEAQAQRFLADGSSIVAEAIGVAPIRVQLQNKDPRSWAEFVRRLSEHSNVGAALTLRNYQALRSSLFDFKDDLAALHAPTLLVVGDEDEPCLETNLFLKRTIPSAGLWVLPNTGHVVNLEEPALFDRIVTDFLGAVERGKWPMRDPRSLGNEMFGPAKT
jgi:pimeloyl-ACP methyl ester carboxylesterase